MTREILVVGCGSIGERHLRCFIKTGRAALAACDSNRDLVAGIATQHNVPAFHDLGAALAQHSYDAVVICTPAHTHIPLSLLALKHTRSVLIEKPLSTSLDGVDQLRQAAAEDGRCVRVAYVYHVLPAIAAAATHLRSGVLGRPLQVSVVAGQHFPTFRPAYRDIYYARREMGGGAIQDALTHLANAMEWMVGPTTRLYCEACHQALEGVEVEDTVSVTARNGNAITTYSLNQFQTPNEMTILVHCEKGSLKIEVHRQRWGIQQPGDPAWDYRPAPVGDRDDLFVNQANAFLDAVEGKPDTLCTLDEAVQTLRFNIAALESSSSGQMVEIG